MNHSIIFAKAPIINKVKTRLNPAISKEMSLELHTAFLQDTLLTVDSLDKNIKKYLFYCFEEGKPLIEKLLCDKGFMLYLQTGKDLGERMHKAFQTVISKGTDKAVIIGTDSPTLPPNYINKAFSYLDKNDIVIGASTDGGYYLIGVRGQPYNIFTDIEWGTKKVLRQTITEIRKQNLKTAILPIWYDVDTFEDLIFLKDHIDVLSLSLGYIPQNTMRYLHKADIL